MKHSRRVLSIARLLRDSVITCNDRYKSASDVEVPLIKFARDGEFMIPVVVSVLLMLKLFECYIFVHSVNVVHGLLFLFRGCVGVSGA